MAARLIEVPLETVLTDFGNVRRGRLSAAQVASLARGIAKDGLLAAPIARPHPRLEGNLQLAIGHRRHAAVRSLGWENIQVEVRDPLSDADVRRLQLQENLEREDLSPIEEATGVRRILVEDGKTQKEVAAEFGMDASEVRRRLNLLKLAPLVQEQIHLAKISPGHGNVLFRRLKDDWEAQLVFAGRAVREALSVRKLDRYVVEHLQGDDAKTEFPTEIRIPNTDPTPTTALEFREEYLPPEGLELEATGDQKRRYLRLGVLAGLMAFNDHELRQSLGLSFARTAAEVDEMWRYVEALEQEEAEALYRRLIRRFFGPPGSGHRSLIPGSMISEMMFEKPSDAPAGASKAGM